MFFEVLLEITLILIFSSFSRNQNQQFSDSEIFKIPELAVINKSKVPAQHYCAMCICSWVFDNFSCLGKECGV